MRLITDSFGGDPTMDTAVSRALMLRVASGDLPETLRISRPGAIVAFGKRDVVSAGYPEAVKAAREGGFEAIERLAGGRAAVFHEDTIAFAHAIADEDPRSRVHERFEATADLMARAFGRLGIDARVGEVPGEYCPGSHSVNARGQRKLMGVGQRLISGGVHVGGVVVVDSADRVRDILVPVYGSLGLAWSPDTTGSVAGERPGTAWDDVSEAIVAEYREAYDLEPAELDDATLELARRLAPEHLSAGGAVAVRH
ncbi:MAG: lipoate--protein ligase family protein [Thermoleophilaceae bacterium]|nr:lipoate--protein ligase family protein [Thermoleophilaceae bacterium]